MPPPLNQCRVAIVGASSLRGKELKELLDERGFPSSDVRLLDDEAVGTLTEAGGEATFIRGLEENSFEGVRFAFFAGDAGFAAKHWPAAHRAGATIIDLSGALAEEPPAVPWITTLDAVFPPAQAIAGKLFYSPSATAIIACTLAGAFQSLPLARMALVFFQPVSERGQEGIDELETQTVKLLSFQPISQEIYDAQVAFNLFTQYGEASRERLEETRGALVRVVARYLAGRAVLPAIQLMQVPVFYSSAVTGFVELKEARAVEELEASLKRCGVSVANEGDPPTSSVSVAGENQVCLGRIEADPNVAGGYWLWGAADNVRLPALNAVQIAEKLLAA